MPVPTESWKSERRPTSSLTRMIFHSFVVIGQKKQKARSQSFMFMFMLLVVGLYNRLLSSVATTGTYKYMSNEILVMMILFYLPIFLYFIFVFVFLNS